MKAIGGYMELELRQGLPYHNPDLSLNSGRNCLKFLLKRREVKTIKIPYFTCDTVIKACEEIVENVIFYKLNESLEIADELVDDGSLILLTNYFGIKDEYIKMVTKKYKNVIVDNAQAFYSKPIKDIDTFYSPRKFFGVPDGGYLYTNLQLPKDLNTSTSSNKISHLVKRIDISAEDGYSSYHKNEIALDNVPIEYISKLTQRLLRSIDYKFVKDIRTSNFKILHDLLGKHNDFKIGLLASVSTPLIYPFQSKKKGLRDFLIGNKIYVAKYWPNLENWIEPNSLEKRLIDEIIPLPIDQRYNKIEMERIASNILKYIKNA